MKYQIRTEVKTHTFYIGGKQIVQDGDCIIAQADIKFDHRDTIYSGLIWLDPQSSYEHWGTTILLKDRIVSDNFSDKDCLWYQIFGDNELKFVPYKYRVRNRKHALYNPYGDHHCDEDTGWSR